MIGHYWNDCRILNRFRYNNLGLNIKTYRDRSKICANIIEKLWKFFWKKLWNFWKKSAKLIGNIFQQKFCQKGLQKLWITKFFKKLWKYFLNCKNCAKYLQKFFIKNCAKISGFIKKNYKKMCKNCGKDLEKLPIIYFLKDRWIGESWCCNLMWNESWRCNLTKKICEILAWNSQTSFILSQMIVWTTFGAKIWQ